MPGAYLWGWDSVNEVWKKLKVDSDGSIHVVGYVDKLSDIGDVLLTAIANNDILYWDADAGKWKNKSAAADVASLTFIIDGGGSAITTGQKGHLEIPFACTINQVTMLADQSGSIVVDIWKQAYADFPPEDANSITASAPLTITTAQKSQDATLNGWTKAIAAGDCIAFNVDSVTDIERVTISLKVTKT